jgi:hypothetical protein
MKKNWEQTNTYVKSKTVWHLWIAQNIKCKFNIINLKMFV